MAIYNGSKIDEASSPEMPLNCYYGQVYLQKAEVLRDDSYTKGLKLHVLAGKTILIYFQIFSDSNNLANFMLVLCHFAMTNFSQRNITARLLFDIFSQFSLNFLANEFCFSRKLK